MIGCLGTKGGQGREKSVQGLKLSFGLIDNLGGTHSTRVVRGGGALQGAHQKKYRGKGRVGL